MKRALRWPGAWRNEGACLEYDPDLWYPEKEASDGFMDGDYTEEKAAFPKSICGTCPVRDQCREYGLKSEMEHGIHGGLDPTEKRKEILRRAQA